MPSYSSLSYRGTKTVQAPGIGPSVNLRCDYNFGCGETNTDQDLVISIHRVKLSTEACVTQQVDAKTLKHGYADFPEEALSYLITGEIPIHLLRQSVFESCKDISIMENPRLSTATSSTASAQYVYDIWSSPADDMPKSRSVKITHIL